MRFFNCIVNSYLLSLLASVVLFAKIINAQVSESEPLYEQLSQHFKQKSLSVGALLQTVGDFQVDFFNDPGEEIFENEFGNGVTGGIGFRRVEADFDFFPHHVLYLSKQQLVRLVLDPSILLEILDELRTSLF